MTRIIGSLGYIDRPEFSYDCISDRIQIESTLAACDDRIVMGHWDDLDPASLTGRAWDVRAGEWIEADFSRSAAILILEAPVPGSKNGDFANADAGMREILRRGIPTVNSVRTFLAYPDKRYLAERSDMPFPKTSLITRETDFGPLLAGLPAEVVIKPLIGCSGRGVTKLPADAEAIRELLEPGREYLIQPFLPEILDGEKSLYFYAKRYRYAAIKRPKPGEFRSNEEFATSEGYEPTGEEIAFAEDVVRRFGSHSLIERIDICGRHVIEMSIECPGLKLKKLGLEKEAGPWTLEAIEMAIARGA
jgi:hypothetical protein